MNVFFNIKSQYRQHFLGFSACLFCHLLCVIRFKERSPRYSCCQFHLASNSQCSVSAFSSELYIIMHTSLNSVPVHTPSVCKKNQMIERCTGLWSVGTDDDYCGSVWTACTVLQLSEDIGNPWGKLTPTLNYRLTLTASLSAHQPANPPSHQPSLTRLPPLPL